MGNSNCVTSTKSNWFYWREKTNTVLDVIRQEGILKQEDISEVTNSALSFPEKSLLIRSDPVTFMRGILIIDLQWNHTKGNTQILSIVIFVIE